eukprot:3707072-Rhodomonas_salina.1
MPVGVTCLMKYVLILLWAAAALAATEAESLPFGLLQPMTSLGCFGSCPTAENSGKKIAKTN